VYWEAIAITTYQILDALEELHEDLSGFNFAQLVFGDNPVEQFALCGKFEDQVHAVALIERILEAKDIRVRDSHQNTNLLL
jgi:hypothetical protein